MTAAQREAGLLWAAGPSLCKPTAVSVTHVFILCYRCVVYVSPAGSSFLDGHLLTDLIPRLRADAVLHLQELHSHETHQASVWDKICFSWNWKCSLVAWKMNKKQLDLCSFRLWPVPDSSCMCVCPQSSGVDPQKHSRTVKMNISDAHRYKNMDQAVMKLNCSDPSSGFALHFVWMHCNTVTLQQRWCRCGLTAPRCLVWIHHQCYSRGSFTESWWMVVVSNRVEFKYLWSWLVAKTSSSVQTSLITNMKPCA